MRLAGLAKSAGTHAAGVVIADRPLTEYVPLQRIGSKDEIITQWTEDEIVAGKAYAPCLCDNLASNVD